MGTGIEERKSESALCGRDTLASVATERQAGRLRKTLKQGDPILDQNIKWSCQEHRARLGHGSRDMAKDKAEK